MRTHSPTSLAHAVASVRCDVAACSPHVVAHDWSTVCLASNAAFAPAKNRRIAEARIAVVVSVRAKEAAGTLA